MDSIERNWRPLTSEEFFSLKAGDKIVVRWWYPQTIVNPREAGILPQEPFYQTVLFDDFEDSAFAEGRLSAESIGAFIREPGSKVYEIANRPSIGVFEYNREEIHEAIGYDS
jgi:hypothetical protein